MRVGRVAVAVVAVVAIAWLGVMERDARLLARGQAAAEAADSARAEADFRAARLLNPDATPDLGRALVVAERRARGRGRARCSRT